MPSAYRASITDIGRKANVSFGLAPNAALCAYVRHNFVSRKPTELASFIRHLLWQLTKGENNEDPTRTTA
jgi:hypothetical protein